ncbi:MAG: hypothetical protein JOZ57_03685 [Abitibacteriaceae bacterium]|nr:hypothetical protein [Abditibacteriaceae bacterium]
MQIAPLEANESAPVEAALTNDSLERARSDKGALSSGDLRDTNESVDASVNKLRFDFSVRVHTYVNDSIRFADTKAALILTACGFIFSFALSQADKFGQALAEAWQLSSWIFGLCIVIATCLGCAALYTIIHAILCVYPNLHSSGQSKVYFGDIAHPIPRQMIRQKGLNGQWQELQTHYVDAVQQITPDHCVNEFSAHNFWLSAIAVRKYLLVQRALKGLCFVFILTLALAISFTGVFAFSSGKPVVTPVVTVLPATSAVSPARRDNLPTNRHATNQGASQRVDHH